MNLPNLERLKAALRANADSINMGVWADSSAKTACGTIGCAAGECDHLMAVDGRKGTVFTKEGWIRKEYQGVGMAGDRLIVCRENGIAFLGVDEEPADKMFLVSRWPDLFAQRLYQQTTGTPAYVEVICDRLDYFADTGE